MTTTNETPKTTLELVSEVQQFADLSEFMGDPHIDKALEYVVKLLGKEMPINRAPQVIVELQALSAKFGILASYYTNVMPGRENAKKKNVYYSMRDNLNSLVDALKYLARH